MNMKAINNHEIHERTLKKFFCMFYVFLEDSIMVI